MSVIGFIIAWILLVVSTYKGHSAIYMSFLCALIVILFSGMGVQEGIIDVYMPALARLCITVFPLVLMGSIFGQVYVDSGAACSIAFALSDKLMKNVRPHVRKIFTIALIYIVGCLLCYGGIDSAALMFTLVPLCLIFFEVADIPRKYVAAVCVHVSCLCLSGIGAPTFYNIYPGLQMGTTPKAGLTVGIIALIINIAGGIIVASILAIKDEKKGLHFEWGNARKPSYDKDNMPNPIVSLIPIVVSMILFVGFNWHFIASIGVGIVLSIILFFKNFKVEEKGNKNSMLIGLFGSGTSSGINGAIVLCSMSAFGAVVQTSPVFTSISNALMNLNINTVIIYVIVVAVLGILTGAAVSGFQAGLTNFLVTPDHMGLSFDVLHRIGAESAATVNLAPYTGVVFVTLNLAGLTHKEGYGVMVKIPLLLMAISTAVSTILYTIFPALP